MTKPPKTALYSNCDVSGIYTSNGLWMYFDLKTQTY